MVNTFVFGARAYEKYVRQEIAAAEVELRCCHIKVTLLSLSLSNRHLFKRLTQISLSLLLSHCQVCVCVHFFVLTMPQHTPVADVALYSIVSIVLVLVAMLVLILGVAGYAIARALTSKKPPTNQAHNLRQVGSRPRPKYS